MNNSCKMAEFKDRLQEALDLKDCKPADLAKLTGLSKSTISQYLSGYAKPKDDKLCVLAKALHCNPAWLWGFDVPMYFNSQQLSNNTVSNSTIFSSNPYIEKYYQLNNDNQQTVNNLIDDLSEKQQRLDALIQQLKEKQSGQTLIAADTGKNKVHQEITAPDKLKHIEELSEKARKNPGAKITD